MSAAPERQGSEICFSIFLPALVMGNFLVLNLFLALLLNSFSCEELKSRKEVSAYFCVPLVVGLLFDGRARACRKSTRTRSSSRASRRSRP